MLDIAAFLLYKHLSVFGSELASQINLLGPAPDLCALHRAVITCRLLVFCSHRPLCLRIPHDDIRISPGDQPPLPRIQIVKLRRIF